MHHGDGLTSILSGVCLSIAANAAGWVDGVGIAGHALQTIVFGFLGGLGGWAAKRCIEAGTERWKRTRNNN